MWVIHFLALVNNTAVNILYKFLCEHIYSFLLGMYLEVELLGHMATLFKLFEELQIVFQSASPFYIFTSNV